MVHEVVYPPVKWREIIHALGSSEFGNANEHSQNRVMDLRDARSFTTGLSWAAPSEFRHVMNNNNGFFNPYSVGELARRALENSVRESMADLDAPHLVVCKDETTGSLTYSGPYASGFDALVAAENEANSLAGVVDGLIFSVAPITSPSNWSLV